MSLLVELEPSLGALPFRGIVLSGLRIAAPLTGFSRDISEGGLSPGAALHELKMEGLAKRADVKMVTVPAKVLDQTYVRDHRNCRLLLRPLFILFVSSSLITPEDRR